MKTQDLLKLMIISISLAACGEAERANEHLEKLEKSAQDAAKQAERIANTMEAFLRLGEQGIKLFNNNFKPKPPAPTDDIDDILNMPGDSKPEDQAATENKPETAGETK
jgi:hypothetical protein